MADGGNYIVYSLSRPLLLCLETLLLKKAAQAHILTWNTLNPFAPGKEALLGDFLAVSFV